MPVTNVKVGHDFDVRVWTEGHGKPLVYLHGFDGRQVDAPFLHRLAQNREVFAPEHPGYGESTGIEKIDDILDMVLYYRQLFGALSIEKADVMGHSLGGMFAAEMAAISPQTVNKLILVSPFGLWLDDTQIPDLFIMSPNQLQRATWADPESSIAQGVLTKLVEGKSGPAAVVERAMNLSAAGKFLWPIPDSGLKKRLGLISAPTLVVVGDADKLIDPAYGHAFASNIPGAKLEVIKQAGHLPMFEQEDAFMSAVESFLG